jgi:hypothetical protein
MSRLSLVLAASAMFSFLAPQTASATPTLEWDGQAELMSGHLGFSPTVLPNGADGDKVAKNIGQGVKGGLYLGVGIPITIVGGIFTGLAIHLFVTADLALAAVPPDEVTASVSRVFGLICLVIGLSALSPGIGLIVKGAKALSKIEASAMTGPDPRMARAEKNRARWGMRFAFAGGSGSR